MERESPDIADRGHLAIWLMLVQANHITTFAGLRLLVDIDEVPGSLGKPDSIVPCELFNPTLVAKYIPDQHLSDSSQTLLMGSFVAMGTIGAKTYQRSARIIPGGQC